MGADEGAKGLAPFLLSALFLRSIVSLTLGRGDGSGIDIERDPRMAGNETAAIEALGRCYAFADPKEMLASLAESQIKCSHVPETVAVDELQEGIKQRYADWSDMASFTVREQLQQLQSEISSAKKRCVSAGSPKAKISGQISD